jgi:hypothetical protein
VLSIAVGGPTGACGATKEERKELERVEGVTEEIGRLGGMIKAADHGAAFVASSLMRRR